MPVHFPGDGRSEASIKVRLTIRNFIFSVYRYALQVAACAGMLTNITPPFRLTALKGSAVSAGRIVIPIPSSGRHQLACVRRDELHG